MSARILNKAVEDCGESSHVLDITEKETGGRAEGRKDDDVEVLFGSDRDEDNHE